MRGPTYHPRACSCETGRPLLSPPPPPPCMFVRDWTTAPITHTPRACSCETGRPLLSPPPVHVRARLDDRSYHPRAPRACSCETGRPLLSPPPPCMFVRDWTTAPITLTPPPPPPPPYSALQFEEQINCKWVVEMLLSIGYDKERNTNEQTTTITILAG